MKNTTRKNVIKFSTIAASALCASAIAVAMPSLVASAEMDSVNVNLAMAGAGVRMTGEKDEAIRFRAGLPTNEYASLSAYDVELGMLVIPENKLEGELSLDNAVEGVSIAKLPVAASATYAEGDMTYYNVVLSNIPEDFYTADILARAYVTLSVNGESKTIYSDVQTRSLAYVAYKESVSGNEHTAEETTALTNYMSGKTFYAVSAQEGLVLDYDYAFEGQELKVDWQVEGKWMKKILINGVEPSWWTKSELSVTMPAEVATVTTETRDQTDTPTVLGANGGQYYTVGAAWSQISNATTVNECTTEQISDEDWAALQAAGYKGSIEKGMVTKAIHPSRASLGGSTNVTFGVALDGLSMIDIFESSAWNDVQSRYYVSIWYKPSAKYNPPLQFCAYDVENKKQGTGGDQNWVDIAANTWSELRIPLNALRTACAYVDAGACPENLSFGLYSYHANLSTDVTVSIYSMELMLNDVTTTSNSSADLSYTGGNPLATWAQVKGFDIYDGATKLVAGKDYTVAGNVVSGLEGGNYKVEYKIASNKALGGALNAYPNGAVITRKLVVTQEYPAVVDDMSTTNGIKVYTGASYETLSGMSLANMSQKTLTDDEYAALLEAGYTGKVTNKTVNSISTTSAANKVFVQLDSLQTNNAFKEVIASANKTVYLSVWMKGSGGWGDSYAFTMGSTTQKGCTVSQDWIETLDGWTNVQYPIYNSYSASGLNWSLNNGYLTANETWNQGFIIWWKDMGGATEGTLDIYSAELIVK